MVEIFFKDSDASKRLTIAIMGETKRNRSGGISVGTSRELCNTEDQQQ